MVLAALSVLAVTFCVSFGSALLPVISVELYVIAVAAGPEPVHWALVAAVVAVGQIAGKTLYYLAARGSIRLPAYLHRTPKERLPSQRRDRWRARTKRMRMSVFLAAGLLGRFARFALLAASPALVAGWMHL